MADVDAPTFDAILLDCHSFYLGLYAFYMYATQHIVRNVFEKRLLSPDGYHDGYIFLHDTGLHRTHTKHDQLNLHPPGWVHQPVERLIALWI